MKIKIYKEKAYIYPLGIVTHKDGFHISAVSSSTSLFLLLYHRNEEEFCEKIEFPKEYRVGNVWSMSISCDKVDEIEELFKMEYNLSDGVAAFPDPYGKSYSGRDSYGKVEQLYNIKRNPIILSDFDWGADKPIGRDFNETIIYKMSVRGFTKSPSSKSVHKGTFTAIVDEDKLNFLKKLGVNAIELLPSQEFEELMFESSYKAKQGIEATGKINYWGYTKAYHFAPKASFCTKKNRNPSLEFKKMVKKLHEHGIEIIPEFYFTTDMSEEYMLSVLRYWHIEYHIDGAHIVGRNLSANIAKDPYLSNMKLIAQFWEGDISSKKNFVALCNDNFQNEMRRVLKGDEAMLESLIRNISYQDKNIVKVNYIADIKGFSLWDLVSYDIKHNEQNGENNKDGTDNNFSWNCGIEGATRKKQVLSLRHRQLRNASILLFLSKGVPMLTSSDEVGQSKLGNNNTYCQDNELSWFNWKLLKKNEQIYKWFCFIIDFRRKHPVFYGKEAVRNMDYLACGMPDVSYHGTKIWKLELEPYKRQLGILYCGKYAKKEDEGFDNDFYVMYNMHWEEHEFDLPRLKNNLAWYVCIDTSLEENYGFYKEGLEPSLGNNLSYKLKARSIAVLKSKEK